MERERYNPSQAHEQAHTPSKSILVVDDEQPILDLLCDIFEEEGYTVFTARNGRDAALLMRQTSVDVVLTDYMMPHMDGHKLIETLRANPRTAHVPVVFMSAVAVPQDSGHTALIRKPFNLAHVLDCVAKQLSHAPSHTAHE